MEHCGSQFASDLDKVTRDMLDRGVRLVEILKQGQYVPLPFEKQVVLIYAGTKGYIDSIEPGKLGEFEKQLYAFIEASHPQIFENLRTKKAIDKDTEEKLKSVLKEFAAAFGSKKAN